MSDERRRAALSWGGAFLALLLLAAAADRIGDRGFEGRCGDDQVEVAEKISILPLADDAFREIVMNLIESDRYLSEYFRSPPQDPLMEFDESNVFAGQIPSGLGPLDPIIVVIGHSLYCGTAGCKAYILEWVDNDWRVATRIDAYNFIDEAIVWMAKGPVRGQWDRANNNLSAPMCIQPPAYGRPLLVSQTAGYIWRNGQWRYFCRRCNERG
jgi:hypothetical protein